MGLACEMKVKLNPQQLKRRSPWKNLAIYTDVLFLNYVVNFNVQLLVPSRPPTTLANRTFPYFLWLRRHSCNGNNNSQFGQGPEVFVSHCKGQMASRDLRVRAGQGKQQTPDDIMANGWPLIWRLKIMATCGQYLPLGRKGVDRILLRLQVYRAHCCHKAHCYTLKFWQQ